MKIYINIYVHHTFIFMDVHTHTHNYVYKTHINFSMNIPGISSINSNPSLLPELRQIFGYDM